MATTFVGVTELADSLGISSRRIQQLVKEGVLPKAERGKYNLDAATVAYRAYLDGAVDGGDLDSAGDKARLLKAQADKAEYEAELARLKVEEQSGQLIPAEQVAQEWGRLVATVKARLLGVPRDVAPLILGIKSEVEAEAVLRKAVVAAMVDLAATAEAEDAPDTPADPQ